MRIIQAISGVLLFVLATLLGQALEGGHISSLIQGPALIIVLGGTLGIAVMGHGLVAAFSGTRSGEQPRQLAGFLSLVAAVAPLAGLLGTIFGLIHTMENLDDPSRIGAGIAQGFVALLYGVGIAALAHGFKHLVDAGASSDPAPPTRAVEPTPPGAPEAEEPAPDPTPGARASSHGTHAGGRLNLTNLGVGLLMFFFAPTLGQALIGGHLSSVIGGPAFIMVVGGAAGIGLTAYGFAAPAVDLIRLILGQPTDARALSGLLRLIRHVAPLLGVVGVLVGMIHVLVYLHEPSKIGAGFALVFLTLMYAIVLAMLAHGLGAAVQRATGALGASSNTDATSASASTSFVLAGFFILMFAFFVVMYAVQTVDRVRSAHASPATQTQTSTAAAGVGTATIAEPSPQPERR